MMAGHIFSRYLNLIKKNKKSSAFLRWLAAARLSGNSMTDRSLAATGQWLSYLIGHHD